jgi:hypothetical protein
VIFGIARSRSEKRHGYRRNLGDFDRTLTNNVTTKNLGSRAVNNQFAEAGCPPVDDRARRRVKVHNSGYDIVCFSRFPLGESYLRVFRIGKASDRIY